MSVMDKIEIKNLEVYAKHGVFPAEKTHEQLFIVTASLFLDLRSAAKTDDLTKTLDYGWICSDIVRFFRENCFNLIETLAEKLAEKLLVENPLLQRVRLEIKKPHAPIGAQLETVSVEIERSRHMAYISLGSNVGDRGAYLNFALMELEETQSCNITDVSELVKTVPYGNVKQGEFLNACLIVETILTPHELLGLLQAIEKKAGRERSERWGPRTLDLDVIFYDDIVMSDDDLRIPHCDMQNRAFVLVPLCEIAPNKLHPVLGKTVKELLEELVNGD